MATKTRVSMRLEVGDRLAEPKGGYRIRMARGESESVEVSAELLDGGRPFDASGLSARFMAVLAGGRHVAMPVPPEGVSGGTLTYTLPSGLGATPGDTRLAVFELSDGEGYRIYTDPFTVSVADGPSPTSAEIGPYVPELDALLAQLKAAIVSANTAADAANTAAGKAADAATKADDAAAKAEAAIAEVKATEAKLYPAAENVLVGSETGTVAHVEDAFNGAALRKITVEGAAKQDGIPSPESPKPITVVENPMVKVVGRNVLDFSFPALQASYSSSIAVIAPYNFGNKWISLPYTTIGSSSGFGFVQKLMPGSYTVKAFNAPAKASVNIAAYKSYEDTKDIGNKLWYISEQMLSGLPSFTVADTAQYVVFCFAAKWEDGTNKITYPADFKAVVEYGGTATEYKPYTEQSIAFTLPAEHPYLAKLPDGTADTIEVDQEGNVELVARVGKVVFDGSQAFYELQDGDIKTYYETSNPIGTGALDAAQWGGLFDRFETGNPYSQQSAICAYSFANLNGVIFRMRPRETFANAAAFVDWLKSNPVTSYYADTEPKTYQLGKIDMPKTQDSIVNVWTDAEVTPNTGIEYVRDVNIVVSHLESAIASITEG